MLRDKHFLLDSPPGQAGFEFFLLSNRVHACTDGSVFAHRVEMPAQPPLPRKETYRAITQTVGQTTNQACETNNTNFLTLFTGHSG
jgi:hypothetical protein